MLHRQRQKRVRADDLHRVGHREQAHAHALHESARERLGRYAHHRHAVHERGQADHQAVVASRRRGEPAQVESHERVPVGILAHAQRPAQVVAHALARRGRRARARKGRCTVLSDALLCASPLRRMREQLLALLVRQPHAQRAHHQQVAVRALPALVPGTRLAPRRPRPVRRQLRGPHLALCSLRGADHVDILCAKVGRIFAHMLNEFVQFG